MDEPRRRGRPGAGRVPRGRAHRRDPDRRDGGPGARPVRRAVPPGGHAHAERHRRHEAVPLRRLRAAAGLDAGQRDRARGRRDPRAGRRRPGPLRALRRRRLGGRGAPGASGGRRPAHVRVRGPRAEPRGRARAGRGDVRPALPDPARPREGRGPVPREAGRRHRPRGEAQGDRRGVHPGVRGGRARPLGRAVPGAGHALSGRDRVGIVDGGQHQEPPQRRRAARGHGVRAGRAAPRPVQGRGPPRWARSSGCPRRSCGASRSPGRAWRCGSSARSRPSGSSMLRGADGIVRDEIRRAGLERETWQAFVRAARRRPVASG